MSPFSDFFETFGEHVFVGKLLKLGSREGSTDGHFDGDNDGKVGVGFALGDTEGSYPHTSIACPQS